MFSEDMKIEHLKAEEVKSFLDSEIVRLGELIEEYKADVKEQGEEEKNSADLITKMELFGNDARSLYMLNTELAGRVYSAPSLVL